MTEGAKTTGVEQQERAIRDLALIDAFRAGEVRAFEELVAAYDVPVRRHLAQLNVAPGDVEDLAQDVFVRIFRNLERFRGGSSFATWLYRITLNVFFDHNKRRKRADARLARLRSSLVDASTAPRAVGDPYDLCSDALAAEELGRAIAALPAVFRDVVAMREVDDLSYEEIAAQIGISVGTVRSRLSRARQRLREVLRPRLAEAAA